MTEGRRSDPAEREHPPANTLALGLETDRRTQNELAAAAGAGVAAVAAVGTRRTVDRVASGNCDTEQEGQ